MSVSILFHLHPLPVLQNPFSAILHIKMLFLAHVKIPLLGKSVIPIGYLLLATRLILMLHLLLATTILTSVCRAMLLKIPDQKYCILTNWGAVNALLHAALCLVDISPWGHLATLVMPLDDIFAKHLSGV